MNMRTADFTVIVRDKDTQEIVFTGEAEFVLHGLEYLEKEDVLEAIGFETDNVDLFDVHAIQQIGG
jgi:hypothetical protein